MVASERRKWLALALLSAVQFMVVLDIAIVNVALPSIKVDLGFSQENLQWVISAYALVFGGFLLLGGRAADLLGRRRLFLAGLVVFTLASLLAGLAWSEASLIAARALPGARRGDHLARPRSRSSRRRSPRAASATSRSASGAPSAASAPRPACCSAASSPSRSAGSGSSSSTCRSAWPRSCSTPFLLDESRDATREVASTSRAPCSSPAASSSLVYAITQAGQHGWLAGETIGFFAASLALLAGFVAWERRHPEPLMRFGILRTKTVAARTSAGFILGHGDRSRCS